MNDLIERLEAAEGGSRALDAEIALAIGAPQEYFRRFDKDALGQPWAGWDDVEGPECYDDAIWGGGGHGWTAPHYSSSIDDARALIPEGWWIESLSEDVAVSRESLTRLGASVKLEQYEHSAQGQAATIPLAIVIAAVKAQEVEDG